MQTVIQVITSGRGSLREKIMSDQRLEKFGLIPTEHQRPGRPHGWAKIHSENAHGAINLEWHGRTGVLTCRVVAKLGEQTALDYRKLHRLSASASSKPYPRHPHHAAMARPILNRGLRG